MFTSSVNKKRTRFLTLKHFVDVSMHVEVVGWPDPIVSLQNMYSLIRNLTSSQD